MDWKKKKQKKQKYKKPTKKTPPKKQKTLGIQRYRRVNSESKHLLTNPKLLHCVLNLYLYIMDKTLNDFFSQDMPNISM